MRPGSAGASLDASRLVGCPDRLVDEVLEELEWRVADGIEPAPVSGGQERLEGLVNRHIWQAGRAR